MTLSPNEPVLEVSAFWLDHLTGVDVLAVESGSTAFAAACDPPTRSSLAAAAVAAAAAAAAAATAVEDGEMRLARWVFGNVVHTQVGDGFNLDVHSGL